MAGVDPQAVENRPFPYLVTDVGVLQNIKESATEGLFKSFEVLLGKDVRENGVKFEALLGVYANAIQFVKFLETSLAVSCINTEFKDLRRMTDGKIQFKITIPTIAHGDGRRPHKQRQYIIMKACNKHHISAEIELAMLDLELLHAPQDTPLDMLEYVGAIKTITSALQFGVDALERGLIDSVLAVKIRHAPPHFILHALSDPALLERGAKKAIKADLIAMFKRHLVENSFFLDKAEHLAKGKQYVSALLADLVGAVTKETVVRGLTTYTTQDGEPVSGVFETTDSVMRRLITFLGQAGSSMVGPASYANYVVRGENLVTAVSYGRVMRSFDQFLSRIVDHPTRVGTPESDLDAIAENSLPSKGRVGSNTTTIPAAIVRVGNSNIALESLQRMYTETQFPHPLNRRMQYSSFFPVGLHLPQPAYTTSATVRGGVDSPLFQSTEAWVVNKNNVLLCFNYQNALRSICHPRMHNPGQCAQALQQAAPDPEDVATVGIDTEVPTTMNLLTITYRTYNGVNQVEVPDVARRAIVTTDDFLHPSMHALMRLEVHPFFDFYVGLRDDGRAVHRAAHRGLSGNIPGALAPPTLHDARGVQLEAASALVHVIDRQTMELIQQTAFDPTYPAFCYFVELMIHGQEDLFLINRALVAYIINSYWRRSGNLAFVNSFVMVRYIAAHLGGGTVHPDAYSHYRRIYGQLLAMEQALARLTNSEHAGRIHMGQFVNALVDINLLPPLAYTDIFTPLIENSDRFPVVRAGGREYDNVAHRDRIIERRAALEDMVNDFATIYRVRTVDDHSVRVFLPLPDDHDPESMRVLEKLFYYVLLPVCTNGHLCGLGTDYSHLGIALAYNGPMLTNQVNVREPILSHLENGTLRDLLIASDLNPSVGMMRSLVISYLTCPYVTQAVRVTTNRDITQFAATHERGRIVGQTVLVNGTIAFAMSTAARAPAETLFYPVPFHKFFADPMVAATLHPVVADFITRMPGQRDAVCFHQPPELFAEYQEWHKSPMLAYVRACEPCPRSLSAMLAMHLKLSPISFIIQAKHRVHPAFALTVVRTDEIIGEHLLYSTRASTSVFVGQPSVTRREVRADAVTFEINHDLASLDTGLGYSSVIAPAHVASIATDMGIHCQDLFAVFPSERYADPNVNEYILQKLGADRPAARARDPRDYIAGARHCSSLPGLSHGQIATCEVVLTPVVADVAYFQTSNSPRGRASCVVSCDAYSADTAEAFLYDHSIPDPAYEFRSTANPWASQRGSLGDVLYNSSYRQLATPGIYSPCRQFFNRDEILKNNKGLFTLITEYSARLSGHPATSTTDLQYVVVNGTDVFLEQPCQFLQEAFPTLSASHRSLMDEFMSSKTTHAPVHMNQYLIEETAPVRRLFKIGAKVVY
ncbi:Major capsid protein [Eptesicus fuscus gammaherpesvirus]|uniref:Major capsid protein n=1 Tax=vespertilionid gammaherpesvirus 3 TaxID=2846598 RepID=A0A2D1A5L3_9GAMA|nr:Major capsid protein [Eptesicus fuscus gammaherpesvirus]ATA58254.1 Major capsid protein [Eptesicus fuscus gammaherpesvirus]WAH70885.1 major capsid protein [Eptesicus fuscus gammaherpesvirus]